MRKLWIILLSAVLGVAGLHAQSIPFPGPVFPHAVATSINYGTITASTTAPVNENYNQWVYFVTGSDVNGYTVNSCSIGLGAYATSTSTDCILDTAPTTTTGGATAICHATYTGTVTTTGFETVPLTGCGTLSANTAYWIGVNTNNNSLPFAFYDCGSSCTGTPTSGSYSSYYAAGTYGVYTGLNLALINAGDLQSSVYITVTPN